MRKRTRRWINAYMKRGNRRQMWKKLVQVMACIVVFCTTYAMILPAITLEQQYSCGLEEHLHTDGCRDEQGKLTCTSPEHSHDDACSSDPTANVESRDQWKATFAGTKITGKWDEDLLAIAKTQLGYEESTRNYQIKADGTKTGYTRYGAWYGAPYRDWNAMFTAFCLNYAQVPQLAVLRNSDSGEWMEQMQQIGILSTPEEYTPKIGEIAFYQGADGVTVQMGVISAMDTQTDTETGAEHITQLSIIAGDVNNHVAEISIPADWLLGACSMDKARERYVEKYPGKQEFEQTPVPETEPATEPEPELPRTLSQTAETENYIVIVSYSSELHIPEEALLKAYEYPRDSETFRRRCEEAGYELDWLLNIGFFIGDSELELNGAFDVQVISKQGDDLGKDITHFAEDSAERINGTQTQDGTEDGQTSISFPAGSFSDFGGGIATVAETGSITLTVVDPSQLTDGAEYVIFVRYGRNYLAMGNNGFASVGIGSGDVPTVGKEIDLTRNSIADCTWRLRKIGNTGTFELYSTATNQRLHIHYDSLLLQGEQKPITTRNVDGAGTKLAHPWSSNNNYIVYNNGWDGAMNSGSPATLYFAMEKNYPHAVHTGTYEVGGLRFYNFCEGADQKITALAGCVFEIKGTTLNGEAYEKTIVSGANSEISFEVPDGDYTITEVSTPYGYLRDDNNTRQFSVRDGKFSNLAAIGLFMNHKLDALDTTKTAEVEDYNNRMYQIMLHASGHLWNYDMDPVDVLFVVDKSNSMLFPSGMNPVQSNGANVTVTLNSSGVGNLANLDALAAAGKISKDEMYYFISDPDGSSTVWCLWHDGETWMYQDASYYAKAKHENGDGYKQGSDTVVFPRNQGYTNKYEADPDGTGNLVVNGGGMGKSLSGSSIATDIDAGSNQFVLYQAIGEYNRLHYLEEALSNMVIELAELNPENTVTLTPFTKEVNHDDCSQHPIKLDVAGVNQLLEDIRNINTSGGTRQDIALKHIHEEHLGKANSEYANTKNFVVLITDGAPAGTSNIGDAKDPANENGSVYAMIKHWANQVKSDGDTTLMTVALGMTNVEGGKEVLQLIASGSDMYCALDDAAALVDRIQQLIFSNMKPKERVDFVSDVTDVISNSFYPIAWVAKGTAPDSHTVLSLKNSSDLDSSKDWIVLQPGDWITSDGKYTTAGASDAAGQLLQNSDGDFYVQWVNLNVGNGWNGTVYVKAKEDFIGGNVIDTNKEAKVELRYPEVFGYDADAVLPTPTVNVRLLDMNEMHSEVTVYLGDIVNEPGNSPLDSLKYFYKNTEFTKLISDSGKILNKPYSGDTPPEGLEARTFTLEYALGRPLTDDEWNTLLSGKPVTVAYTYDYESNNGNVGYFTLSLEKTGIAGSNPDYAEHEATAACQPNGVPDSAACTNPAETYTLNISYDAYRIGTEHRPTENVHNGPAGPGINVGTGSTLETGLGELDKENVHEVHVISGKIVITKVIDDTLKSASPQTYVFHVTDSSGNVTEVRITIPAYQTTATAELANLPRDTYVITEAVDADSAYMVKSMDVVSTTNCENTDAGDSVTFVMGNNTGKENVIGKQENAVYTSYIDPVNGVLGEITCTNTERVFEGEIPVVKVWDDGNENHGSDAVYVVLYKDGNPVTDTQGRVRMLKLDASGNWQGSFTVVLANMGDKVTNYNYSVREVSQISEQDRYEWHKAVLEGTDTTIWYEKALDPGGTLGVGNKGYVVQYEAGTDGAWTVTNYRGYELPETGGTGTSHFTFGGLLMIAAALMYICITGHKRRKGGRYT